MTNHFIALLYQYIPVHTGTWWFSIDTCTSTWRFIIGTFKYTTDIMEHNHDGLCDYEDLSFT
jgi:hypothetical protein